MKLITSQPVFTLDDDTALITEVMKNVFTYQVTGSGTATIQGSNDNVNWFNLTTADITAPGSLVAIHSWRYIRKTGTASVLVSRA